MGSEKRGDKKLSELKEMVVARSPPQSLAPEEQARLLEKCLNGYPDRVNYLHQCQGYADKLLESLKDRGKNKSSIQIELVEE